MTHHKHHHHAHQHEQPPHHAHEKAGEGPSADRLDRAEYHRETLADRGGGGGGATLEAASLAPGTETLNQDGSRLDAAGGYGTTNPGIGEGQVMRHGQFVHPAPETQPIGVSDDALLRENGASRELHPGIAGGPAPSDFGASGSLGLDPSNIGLEEDF